MPVTNPYDRDMDQATVQHMAVGATTLIKAMVQCALVGLWGFVVFFVLALYGAPPHLLPLWWRVLPCAFMALNFGMLCFVRRIHGAVLLLAAPFQLLIAFACVAPLGRGV